MRTAKTGPIVKYKGEISDIRRVKANLVEREDLHLSENFVLGETPDPKPTSSVTKTQNIFIDFLFIVVTIVTIQTFSSYVCLYPSRRLICYTFETRPSSPEPPK